MPNKPKMVWTICQLCKKPYKVALKELKRGRKYCSRSCASRSHLSIAKQEQTGANNPNWKGGRVKHCKGYIYAYAPDHPRQHNGYVLEHILVAEEKLGRKLKEGETVHHKNGKRWDNRPSNLAIFASSGEHTSYHIPNMRRDQRGRFLKNLSLQEVCF